MSRIGVYYDYKTFQAGSKLSGSVCLDVKEELAATGLIAVLEGREKTAIPYKETDKDGYIQKHWAKSRRQLVELNIPLNSSLVIQNGKILPGKYELPFEIELPDALPSTIAEMNSPGVDVCSVEYGIEAEVQGCQNKNPHNYICRDRAVVLGKPLPKDPVPYMNTLASDLTNTALRRLHLAKAFGKEEQLLVGVFMSDTLLDRGEKCQLALSCRNHTKFEVTHVRAEIRETFRWSAKDHTEQTTTVIASFEFGRFHGVEQTKSTATIEEDLDQMQKELKERKHKFTVTIPTTAHDTFLGTLIKVSHEIIVDFETTHDYDNPRLEIPIQVGPPTLTQGSDRHLTSKVSMKPQDWESTSMSDRVSVGQASAVLGGSVVHNHDKSRQTRVECKVPSLETLLQEMKEYINDYDLIRSHVQNPEWRHVFRRLTPQEYGKVIKSVELEFDQSKVAALMAPIIHTFTVDYLVVALKGSSDWNRMGMIDRLISHCTDLDTRAHVLECELTRYEDSHCAKYFRLHNDR